MTPTEVPVRGVTFDSEPEWMKKARTVPVRSTWESRQPVEPKADSK